MCSRLDAIPRRGIPTPLRSTSVVSHDPGGLPLLRLPGVFQPETLVGFGCWWKYLGRGHRDRPTEIGGSVRPDPPVVYALGADLHQQVHVISSLRASPEAREHRNGSNEFLRKIRPYAKRCHA